MTKLYHILYRIDRKDGHFYFGIHSTNNLDDGYMGSGTRLRSSIKKHGKKFHVKTILSLYETRQAAEEAERSIVTAELLSDPRCLNLTPGGKHGPADHILSTAQKISKALQGNPKSVDHRANISNALIGKQKSNEHCQKLSVAMSARAADPNYVNPFSGVAGSKMSSEQNLRRVKEGTNPWAGKKGSENSKRICATQLAEGRHPFQGRHGSEHGKKMAAKQLAAGTHAFLNLPKLTCHCGKTGSAPNMRRWHLTNCKVPR